MKNEEFDLLDNISEHANSPKKAKYTPNSIAQKVSSKHRAVKSSFNPNDKNRNINNKNNLKLDLVLENSKNKNTINSIRKEKKDDKFTRNTPDYKSKSKMTHTYKSQTKRKSVNNDKNILSKINIIRNNFQIDKNFKLTNKKRFDITTPDIIQENSNNKQNQENKQHNLHNTLNIKNNKGSSADSRKIKNSQKINNLESKNKDGELNLSHSIKKECKDFDNISKKNTIKGKKLNFHEKKESELISKKNTIKEKKDTELISKKSTFKEKKESELISKKSTLKEKKEDKKTNKKNTLKEIKEEKQKKIISKEIKEEKQYKENI
jgi:hypothetical protein